MYGFFYTQKNHPTKTSGVIYIYQNYKRDNANLFNNPDSTSVNKDCIP